MLLLLSACIPMQAQVVSNRLAADSIKQLLKRMPADTNKVKTLNKIGLQLTYTGNYKLADSLVNEALGLSNNLNYNAGIANSYCSKGILYNYERDYLFSYKFLLMALKMYDAQHNKKGIAIANKFIGAVYAYQGDTTNAHTYINKALIAFYELKDTNYIAITLLNQGGMMLAEKNYNRALTYYQRSADIFRDLNNKDGVGSALLFSAVTYEKAGEHDSAIKSVMEAKPFFEQVNDIDGLSGVYHLLGIVALARKDYKQSINYEETALKLGYQVPALDCIMDAEEILSQAYDKKGDGSNALLHYKAFTKVRDSIYGLQVSMKTMNTELNYEQDKKAAEQKAMLDKQEAVQQAEDSRSQTIIYFGIAILIILLVFVAFIYNANIGRKKDSKVIEGKNLLITESINYAEKIQRAILPGVDALQQLLPESFILFKPKDVVSGDFYFIQQKEGKIILAIADCTGHGVPGGFLSMLCFEKLSDLVAKTFNSAEILASLNNGVKASLHQSEGEDSNYDSVEMGLCVMYPSIDNIKIDYSGAMLPIWIIRKGTDFIEEIKPTPKSIGGFTQTGQEYNTTIIRLQKGDTFYMFTDGYIDQFGGDESKKFGKARLQEKLIGINRMHMIEQYFELEKSFNNWRNGYPQLDDVLVVGVRV